VAAVIVRITTFHLECLCKSQHETERILSTYIQRVQDQEHAKGPHVAGRSDQQNKEVMNVRCP